VVKSFPVIRNVLLVLTIVDAIALASVILFQRKGAGVGSVFGGGSESYRSLRGAEKFLHYATIVLAFLFAALSFTLLVI